MFRINRLHSIPQERFLLPNGVDDINGDFFTSEEVRVALDFKPMDLKDSRNVSKYFIKI